MHTPLSKTNARLASDVNPEESQDYAAKRSPPVALASPVVDVLERVQEPMPSLSLQDLLHQLISRAPHNQSIPLCTEQEFLEWIQLFARLILEQREPNNASIIVSVLSRLGAFCAGEVHNKRKFDGITNSDRQDMSRCLSQEVIASLAAQCSELDSAGSIADLVSGLNQLMTKGWIAPGAQIPIKTWLDKMNDLGGRAISTCEYYGRFLLHFEQLAIAGFFSDTAQLSSDLIIGVFEKLIALAERPDAKKVLFSLVKAMTSLTKLIVDHTLFHGEVKIPAALILRVLSLSVAGHERTPQSWSFICMGIADCCEHIEWGNDEAIPADTLDQFIFTEPCYSSDTPGIMLGIGRLCESGHVKGRITAMVKFSELAEQLHRERFLSQHAPVERRIAMFLNGAGKIAKYNEKTYPNDPSRYSVKCVTEDDLYFLLKALNERLPVSRAKTMDPDQLRQIGDALAGVNNLIQFVTEIESDMSRPRDFMVLMLEFIDSFLLNQCHKRDYFFQNFSMTVLGASVLVERFPDCDQHLVDCYKEQLTRQVMCVLDIVRMSDTSEFLAVARLYVGIAAFTRAFWIKRDALLIIINRMIGLLESLLGHSSLTAGCIATMMYSLVWLSYRSEMLVTDAFKVKIRRFINTIVMDSTDTVAIQQLLLAVSFFDDGNLAHYPQLSSLAEGNSTDFSASLLETEILDRVQGMLHSATLKRQQLIENVITRVDGLIPVPGRNLVIQVDGKSHDLQRKRDSDQLCDALLKREGYRVVRIHWRDWERCNGDVRRQKAWLFDFLSPALGELIKRPYSPSDQFFFEPSRRLAPSPPPRRRPSSFWAPPPPLPDRMPPPPGPRRK